jgi:hypothetical protein
MNWHCLSVISSLRSSMIGSSATLASIASPQSMDKSTISLVGIKVHYPDPPSRRVLLWGKQTASASLGLVSTAACPHPRSSLPGVISSLPPMTKQEGWVQRAGYKGLAVSAQATLTRTRHFRATLAYVELHHTFPLSNPDPPSFCSLSFTAPCIPNLALT